MIIDFTKANYHFLTVLCECDHLEWFKWAPTIGGSKGHESNIAWVGFFYPFGTTQQTNISPFCWEEERFLFKGRICDHSISSPVWKRKRKTNRSFDFNPYSTWIFFIKIWRFFSNGWVNHNHNPRFSTMISCPEVSRSLCTEMGARSGAMRCSCIQKMPSSSCKKGREGFFLEQNLEG